MNSATLRATRYCPIGAKSTFTDDTTTDVSYVVLEMDHEHGSTAPLASHDDLETAQDHVLRLVSSESGEAIAQSRPIRFSYFWRPVERYRSNDAQDLDRLTVLRAQSQESDDDLADRAERGEGTLDSRDADQLRIELIGKGVDVDGVERFLAQIVTTWDSCQQIQSLRDLTVVVLDAAHRSIESERVFRIVSILDRYRYSTRGCYALKRQVADRLLEISGIS